MIAPQQPAARTASIGDGSRCGNNAGSQLHGGGFWFVVRFPFSAFDGMRGNVTLNRSDLVDFLDSVLRSSTHDAVGAAPPPQALSFTNPAGRKILQFVETYFYELRELICKNNKAKFPISRKLLSQSQA